MFGSVLAVTVEEGSSAMSETTPRLIRINPQVDDTLSVLEFGKKTEVTIGRSEDATFMFPFFLISRNHAAIKCVDDKWTVEDCKSLNGIWVNNNRITPEVPCPLNENDTIVFGCEEHKYRFVFGISTEEENKQKKRTLQLSPSNTNNCPDGKKTKLESTPVSKSFQETKQRLEETEKLLAEKTKSEEVAQEKLQQKEKLLQDIDRRMKLKSNRRSGLKEKYDTNLQKIQSQLKDLVSKKTDLVSNLMSQEVSGADIEKELLSQKTELENIIKQKEAEAKKMKKKLHEVSSKLAESEKLAETAKKEASKNFNSVVESQLQCCICSELMIQATTLNCAHSFCKFCIQQWINKKKQHAECPACRAKITSQTGSVVIDSFIDSIIDTLTPEKKQSRQALVNERKQLKSPVASTSVKGPGTSAYSPIEIGSDASSSSEFSSDDGLFSSDSEDLNSYICGWCGDEGHYEDDCPYS